MGAHKSEASNLLKLKCMINNELVCCFLELKATNSFMISQAVEQLGFNIKLVADPIMVHLAYGIVRPSLGVALDVVLYCEGVQFFENFILCDLNNFGVILRNTFWDAYKLDIFQSGSKVKICAKVGSKLMHLNVEYNFALAEVGVNLVVLANGLKLPIFFGFNVFESLQGKPKPQGAK